jgi:hypothetical protein
MTDMKQAPTSEELTDQWLRSLGGVWVQMEFEDDFILFKDGERSLKVYTARDSVMLWMPGKPSTHEAVVHWVKTREHFAWVCRLFCFPVKGVSE